MFLKGKVAVITGSTKGIGFGIAKKMHDEGAYVVINSRSEADCKKACKKLGEKRCMFSACDISKREEVKKMMNLVVKKYKRIDILVNNAGIYPFKSFSDLDDETWDKTMAINLNGVYYCAQEALKKMKKGGRIVNISSVAAHIGFSSLVHYCASKGGVEGFTGGLAIELAPKGITVNAVAPGAINVTGKKDAMKNNPLTNSIPLKCFGEPKDIANLVAFLVSDEASYITGECIKVDGGMTIRNP